MPQYELDILLYNFFPFWQGGLLTIDAGSACVIDVLIYQMSRLSFILRNNPFEPAANPLGGLFLIVAMAHTHESL